MKSGMMLVVRLFLAALIIASRPAPCFAGGGPESKADSQAKAAAKEHWKRGVVLMNDSAYAEALAEFEAAERLYPEPTAEFRFNIANAQKRLFRYVEAIESLHTYLAGSIRLSGERRVQAEELIEEMKAQLADITLSVTPDGAEITVDGRAAGKAPVAPLTLTAGTHVLEVTAEGHKRDRREITVAGGVPLSFNIHLQPLPKTGFVRITSSVVKSVVSIDGKAVGEAPVRIELPVGGHSVMVSSPGFLRYQSELAITGGEDRSVPIVLDPLPTEPKKPAHKQWWPWTIGAVVIGGAAAAGTGVWLAGRHEEPNIGGLGSTMLGN